MVDYMEALKRPFSDLKLLVIYIIINMIPIVNFIGAGYLLDVAQTAMKKQKKLPEFKDWWGLFVEGCKSAAIGFVYMIPILIIIVALIGLGMGIGLTGLTLGTAGIAGLGMLAFVFVVIGSILLYFATGAILRYAEKREFKQAFNFSEISKKVFTKTYFIGWLVGMVITWVIALVLGMIPVVGSLLGAGIGGIFYMSVMGEVYREV